jgi:hypothetical protein
MKAIQPGEVVQSDSTSKVQSQEWISAESWKLMKLENAEDTSAYASWQWAIPDICICDLKSSRQQLLPLSLSLSLCCRSCAHFRLLGTAGSSQAQGLLIHHDKHHELLYN